MARRERPLTGVDDALALIDRALPTCTRRVIEGDEVRDLLLDIRSAIAKAHDEED